MNNNPTGKNQYTGRGGLGGMSRKVIRAALPHKITVGWAKGAYSVSRSGGFKKYATTASGALARIRELTRSK